MKLTKTFILAPDSFKGTMAAEEICALQSEVIRAHYPDAVIHAIPMADGGEGMVQAYLRLLGGERIQATVRGPLADTVRAEYGILPDGTAVMEMAAAAGLPLMGEQPNPMLARTDGVGGMILDAAERGVRHILMGLGGSATNDCGIGMAAALGYRFLDDAGEAVEPLAANMKRIVRIVRPERLPEVAIRAACDVDNPLCGPTGATYTFGAQKGADARMQAELEEGLAHMAALIRRDLGMEVLDAKGAGAAGGLGAGMMAFLGASLQPGIELLLDTASFDGLLEDADYVLTGEGRIDWQSAHGKVPMGVGLRCKKKGVPCIALCGAVGEGAEAVYDCGITAMFSAIRGVGDFESVRKTCREDMRMLTDSVLRLLSI